MNTIKKAVLISLGGLILLTSGCETKSETPLPSISTKNGFILIEDTAIKIDKIERVVIYKMTTSAITVIYAGNRRAYTYSGTIGSCNKFKDLILEIYE